MWPHEAHLPAWRKQQQTGSGHPVHPGPHSSPLLSLEASEPLDPGLVPESQTPSFQSSSSQWGSSLNLFPGDPVSAFFSILCSPQGLRAPYPQTPLTSGTQLYSNSEQHPGAPLRVLTARDLGSDLVPFSLGSVLLHPE